MGAGTWLLQVDKTAGRASQNFHSELRFNKPGGEEFTPLFTGNQERQNMAIPWPQPAAHLPRQERRSFGTLDTKGSKNRAHCV